MAGFVKLHCSILRSTIWFDRVARDVFLTALLLAEPREIREPTPALHVDRLEPTGFIVPPGWYGYCETSGEGLVHTARVENLSDGLAALARMGEPEPSSRSQAHDGRRVVRVDGGYIVLNYDKYREKDTTTAERSRRYRDRRHAVASRDATSRARGVTQAEAEAEADQNPPIVPPPGVDAPEGDPWGLTPTGTKPASAPSRMPQDALSTPTPATPSSQPKTKPGRKPGRKPGPRTVKCLLPDDWSPNDAHREEARKLGVDCDDQSRRMRDWAAANGRRMADWDATFRNWLRRSVELGSRPSNPRVPVVQPPGATRLKVTTVRLS